jgi:hypothetical protein
MRINESRMKVGYLSTCGPSLPPTRRFPVEDALKQEQIAEAKDSRELAVFAKGKTYRRTSVPVVISVRPGAEAPHYSSVYCKESQDDGSVLSHQLQVKNRINPIRNDKVDLGKPINSKSKREKKKRTRAT